MIDILLQTAPFFALIGLGFGAGASGFFPPAATAALTRFVFFFALSALLFRFAATLSLADVFEPQLALGYLVGTGLLYALALIVALARRNPLATAAMEAQCAVIGNTGFLGIPLLVALFGTTAIAPLMLVLGIDLVVFSSLIVILITAARQGRIGPNAVLAVIGGLLRNPMILSIALGFGWSALGLTLPRPADVFLTTLGNAATPGALFAIGASLAERSAERMETALWLSFCKLVLHPLFVAIALLWWLTPSTQTAAIAIAAAALPVAGNVFMLAQHYGVAAQRVSAAILISTALSVLSVPAILNWLGAG